MIYYANDNTIINTEGFKYINEGQKAKVYLRENTILKVFNSRTAPKYVLRKNVFKKIKKADIPHFIKLQKYFHQYKGLNQLLWIDGYSYDYIEKDDTVFLYQDKEYLLEMVRQLEEAIEAFSNNNIKIFDCHGGNIIFNNNSVTIIDPDMFTISSLPHSELLKNNKREILNYIRSTIHNDMYANERKSYDRYNYTTELYDIKVKNDTCLAKELDERIKVKTIRDSIKKQ